MKTVLTSMFSCALMLGIATAQNSAAPPSASPASQPQTSISAPPAQPMAPESSDPAPPMRIAAGSVIPVSLTKTIDAKKAKTGDEVVAKVTADLKTSSGEMLVPKDTKVVGRVTEAQPRNKEQKESVIGIAFDRAVMKNGSEMQMPMSIQAIIGPQNNQKQCRRKRRRSSKQRNRRLSKFLANRRDGGIHAVSHALGSVPRAATCRAIRGQGQTRVPRLQRRDQRRGRDL